MSATAPIRLFVLAGQSNVLGQAKLQHLTQLISSGDVDDDLQEFKDTDGSWVKRDDVFVTFDREYGEDSKVTLEGGLAANLFGGDDDTFGPETGFGFQLGDEFEEDVLILKAAGVSALALDWISPSSNDGTGGSFYQLMLEDIQDAITRANDIVSSSGQEVELSGIVWWHGYADVFVEAQLDAYQDNLQNWISDVRTDLEIADLPIVIGQLGGQGSQAGTAEIMMRQIQENVVANTANTVLSNTAQLVTKDVVTTEVCNEDFHYWCDGDVMVNIGRGFAKDMITLVTGQVDNTPSAVPSGLPSLSTGSSIAPSLSTAPSGLASGDGDDTAEPSTSISTKKSKRDKKGYGRGGSTKKSKRDKKGYGRGGKGKGDSSKSASDSSISSGKSGYYDREAPDLRRSESISKSRSKLGKKNKHQRALFDARVIWE